MKKLKYTLEEARNFFPIIMKKDEINRFINKLKKDLYGTRKKLKVFNKKIHKLELWIYKVLMVTG